MQTENNNEIWQVEVGGQLYEAPWAELPDWIDEGSLQPEDKIRKGNLRWIEARKVPALVPFFNAKADGRQMPITQTVTEPKPEASVETPPINASPSFSNEVVATPAPTIPSRTVEHRPNSEANTGQCFNHPDLPLAWICTNCSLTFCKGCPRSYGGNVRICPECGSMCRSEKEVAEANKKQAMNSRAMNEGFGFADLGSALAYPFKFRSSLFFGGLMFMFFTVGQSASGIGGIMMVGASIVCVMLANMLTFGILANTATNFTQGNLEADFMPSFEDFSIWDDVVHPFFLSVGAYLVSFGPLFLVGALGVYMAVSSLTAQAEKFNDQVSKIPGTELYAPDRTVEQSRQVQELLSKVKQRNEDLVRQKEGQVIAAESADPAAAPAPPPVVDDAEDLQRSLQEARTEQLASISQSAEDPQAQYREMISGLMRVAAPIVVLSFLALCWGLIYFPVACSVAGYSRSFLAVINPMVGIDTIRRMGVTYVKILAMTALLAIAAGFVQIFLSVILSPFQLPRLGNLPAVAIGSFVTFYFWIVFFCVLGYAMFKSADRLKLYK